MEWMKVASNIHKCTVVRPQLKILNISALYWSAQSGLASRCRAMAEEEEDVMADGLWTFLHACTGCILIPKFFPRIASGTCCLMRSANLWVVHLTHRASDRHLNSFITLLTCEVGSTSLLTDVSRRREGKKYSRLPSQICVRNHMFNLFFEPSWWMSTYYQIQNEA